MSVANKVKGLLSWWIKETHRKEIHPVIPQVTVPCLLQGKVALIMGGHGGIGKAIVDSFVKSGCKVIVVSRNVEKVKTAFSESSHLAFIRFDLSNLAGLDDMVMQAISCFGKIDILVNTAGTHTENVDFWTVSEKEYDRVLDINLKGCYFVSRSIATYMKIMV